MHPKTPISIALIVNILMTTLIAVIAGMTAFWAINSAVERAVKQDVSRDISVMLDRAPERGVIADIAVLTGSVGKRIFVDTTDSDEPVYLLANHAGEKIVGNVDMPPDVVANSWMELDGIDLGAAPGGWSQVAQELVGEKGTVIASDILPMDTLTDVTFVQGDFTDEAAQTGVYTTEWFSIFHCQNDVLCQQLVNIAQLKSGSFQLSADCRSQRLIRFSSLIFSDIATNAGYAV